MNLLNYFMEVFMGRISGARIEGSIVKNIEDLKDLCSFNNDLSGENGPEFTDSEAIELGFECTGDYICDQAVQSSPVLEEQIEYALKEICRTDQNYDAPTVVDLENGSYYAAIVVLEES